MILRATVVVLMAALALAACGRKGNPVPPPDADVAAPRVYPVDRSQPAVQAPPETEPQGQPPVGPPAASPPSIFYSR
jgi:predicted small lipoprotein YifL